MTCLPIYSAAHFFLVLANKNIINYSKSPINKDRYINFF